MSMEILRDELKRVSFLVLVDLVPLGVHKLQNFELFLIHPLNHLFQFNIHNRN